MLALVTEASSGTVVIHRVSIILPQEFIPYQPDSRIFFENPNNQSTAQLQIKREEGVLSDFPSFVRRGEGR